MPRLGIGLSIGSFPRQAIQAISSGGGGISPVTVNAGQTANLTTPPGSWTLGTLFFRSGGNLPIGVLVQYLGNEYAALGNGTWEDINTGDPATNTPISGDFVFINGTISSITFWDIPPP
jgi:hypothetical protein